MVGIYKITSPKGKLYIGQSYDIQSRFRRYKRMTCQQQTLLHRSLVKHGSLSHTYEVMIEFPKDVESIVLDNYEQFVIAQYREAGAALLNVMSGGSNGRHSEESKQKIREANTGKVFTAERCANISKSLKGKPGNRKGMKNSDYTRKKISEARKSMRWSEEHKKALSDKLKGRIVSEETRKKLSDALKGKPKTAEHIAKTRRK